MRLSTHAARRRSGSLRSISTPHGSRQKPVPARISRGKFTLAFAATTRETKAAVLELTYNWGVDKYEVGSGYGHIASRSTCLRRLVMLPGERRKVLRPAGPMSAWRDSHCLLKTRTATRLSSSRRDSGWVKE